MSKMNRLLTVKEFEVELAKAQQELVDLLNAEHEKMQQYVQRKIKSMRMINR